MHINPRVRLNIRGSALISALFMMALIAIAITAMSMRLQTDIKRTQLVLTSDKLYLASEAVTFWAMNALATTNKPFISHAKNGSVLAFPKTLATLYPGIILKGHLFDKQAYFNINNLQDKKYHPVFSKLLEQVLKQPKEADRDSLINAIQYWLTSYQLGRGHDNDLGTYLKLSPPYLPSFQPMQHPSELRLVKGINANLYQTLLPSITALPEVTAININTAPKSLLMTLGNVLDETAVDELLQERDKPQNKEMNQLNQLIQKLDIPRDQITTESIYYLCEAIAIADEQQLTIYTLLKRTKNRDGTILVSILNQSINVP